VWYLNSNQTKHIPAEVKLQKAVNLAPTPMHLQHMRVVSLLLAMHFGLQEDHGEVLVMQSIVESAQQESGETWRSADFGYVTPRISNPG
jgi:hypothetical protein